mmetsp:Transcript_134201/g.218457  ORF Transcript_134201/g.218457 Transcript_134201/m.218457 type:complete len:80 (-) Transcript_134201:219-458(-)
MHQCNQVWVSWAEAKFTFLAGSKFRVSLHLPDDFCMLLKQSIVQSCLAASLFFPTQFPVRCEALKHPAHSTAHPFFFFW